MKKLIMGKGDVISFMPCKIYTPPKNKDGSYRDKRSNTVEDAAAFERLYNSHMYMDEDPDYDPDEEDDDEDDDDYDRCRCSDPGCPCSGSKRGIP